MENKETIHINFWDDFWDDGYVPEGKKQECYAYVEQKMEEEEKIKVMDYLFDFINKNFPMKAELKNVGGQIRLTNITHKELDSLMGFFDKQELLFEGRPLNIYSES